MDTTNHDAALQQWLADEAAVRARQQAVGVARPDQVQGLTGLEILKPMLPG